MTTPNDRIRLTITEQQRTVLVAALDREVDRLNSRISSPLGPHATGPIDVEVARQLSFALNLKKKLQK